MFKLLKLSLVLLLSISFVGCSSLGWLKFWGDEDEEIELPAVLEEINQELLIKSLWSSKVGKEKMIGRILPSIVGDNIYYINSEGELYVFDMETGKSIWKKQTNDEVSGGLQVGFKKIIYATLSGQVVALDIENGEEIWREQCSSEILSPAVSNGTIVAVQATDGSITGLNLDDGKKSWVHQVSVPNLSLRGTSIPLLTQGFIFTGFANGSVSMIYPDSGAVRLEFPVTINEGSTELERMVDVDGKVVVANNVLVAATFQGNITAIDLQQGRPIWQEKISSIRDLSEARARVIAVDEKDIVKAFGLSSGATLWQQEGLKLRNVSSPVSIRGNVMIGDFEGFVHILNSIDGSFIARKKISKNPIQEIITKGNNAVITDNSGKLFFLSIE